MNKSGFHSLGTGLELLPLWALQGEALELWQLFQEGQDSLEFPSMGIFCIWEYGNVHKYGNFLHLNQFFSMESHWSFKDDGSWVWSCPGQTLSFYFFNKKINRFLLLLLFLQPCQAGVWSIKPNLAQSWPLFLSVVEDEAHNEKATWAVIQQMPLYVLLLNNSY